jgi:hypothetical protein
MVMSAVLVVVIALVAIMPLVAHAIPVWGDNPHYSGGAPPPSNTGSSSGSGNSNSNSGSATTQTIKQSRTVTLTNTTTTVTITKTYTQVVTKTYVINHYIEYYMYPTLKWVFTLVNIGGQQAPGYHSVGNQLMFTPGFGGGSGIFVPVYAQEAVYAFNYAPSVKPVITGWYVGGTSESSSPPQLAGQSVDTYLSGIQEAVNTIQQQAKVTLTNTTTIINNTKIVPVPKPGQNNTIIWTPPPYYYSQADINNAYSTAWNDLVHGDILGAWYQAGRGAYMQTWNFLASAVYSAYKFMQVAKNAFNTATLAKSIGLAFNLHL